MKASCRARRGRRRVVSSALCWRTCSCTTRSTCGWRGITRTFHSSAMRMMRFVTAKAPKRRRHCGARLQIVLACELELHHEKTKIVYCKDANRRGDFPNIHFDFLLSNSGPENHLEQKSCPRLHAGSQPESADVH